MPAPFLVLKSFSDAAENLACDEAMLNLAEETDLPGFLRFFEPQEYFVVLGYSKHLSAELHEEECGALGIPILRRCTGGGTVLQGPGCLNYSLVLPIDAWPDLETITGANRNIMERNRAALSKLLAEKVQVQGHSDLTVGGMKFSGNAQRRKRRCLLFHGSILLNFNLALIDRVLKEPAQQPEYRAQRVHRDFVRNSGLTPGPVIEQISAAWGAVKCVETLANEIEHRTYQLAVKYRTDEWNRRV